MQKSSKVAAWVAGCIVALIFIKNVFGKKTKGTCMVSEGSVDGMAKLDSMIDCGSDGGQRRLELADELYFYSKKMPDGQRMLKLETNFKIRGNSDSPSTIAFFDILEKYVAFVKNEQREKQNGASHQTECPANTHCSTFSENERGDCINPDLSDHMGAVSPPHYVGTKNEYTLEESRELGAESVRRDVGYLKSLQENNMVPGSLLSGKDSA